MFGVHAVQEFKLRLILFLSKTLFLEVASVSKGAIRTDPREKSSLCLQCNMKEKENKFKTTLLFQPNLI